jgi:iron(III) transport system substrate-binding protein
MRLSSMVMSGLLGSLLLSACSAAPAAVPTTVSAESSAAPGGGGTLTVYSGRSESLVAPFFAAFSAASGIQVEVRYGDSAELAATILEEGANSPADLFFAQDAGALGALSAADLLQDLPATTLGAVDSRFVSVAGDWVGVSGRARVLVYNTDRLTEADLPDSVTELTDAAWAGRVGWAPTNASFQAFVTALRVSAGDEAARSWLAGMIANETRVYEKNSAIVNAVAAGEIDVGLVNHYYLYQLQRDAGGTLAAANYTPRAAGDLGGLINIAGAAILKTAGNPAGAQQLIDYMLASEGQRYFAEQTFEYPLVSGVSADARLTPLDQLAAPEFDLNNLRDLKGTLDLLLEVGAL